MSRPQISRPNKAYRRLSFDCLEHRTTPAALSNGLTIPVTDPIQVETGLINNDAFVDIVALGEDGTISVFFGSATGDFGSAVTTTTPAATTGFAIGDFDGDGVRDLLLADGTSGITTRSGSNDGVFAAPVAASITASVSKVARANLNNDVYDDFVGFGLAAIVVGNGDSTTPGTFTNLHNFVGFNSYPEVGVGDFDNDTDDDLAFIGLSATNLTGILTNEGGGGSNFTVATFATTSTPTDLAVGEFDGNAGADVVVSFSDKSPDILKVVAAGTIVNDTTTLASLPSADQVLALILNDDGIADLALFSNSADTLAVFGSDGAGMYTADPDGSDAVVADFVHAADLDGDGYTDVLAGDAANDLLRHFHCRFRTTTTITNSATTINYGDSITIDVQVLPAFDAAQSTNYGKLRGDVEFYIDGVLAGTQTVSLLGQASLSVPTSMAQLTVGTPSITAKFTGGIFFRGSTSSAFQPTVNKGNVASTISGPSSSTYGDQVTFIVTITPPETPPLVVGPTGMVNFFMDGSVPLGSGNIVETTSPYTYTVTFDISNIPAGMRTITADYPGDGNWNNASTSNSVTINIAKATPTITLSAVPTGPVTPGQNVDFTAAFSVPAGTTATGMVDLVNNGTTTIGSPNIVANSAMFGTTSLPTGSNAIVASYAGDDNFNAATSNTVTVVVGTPNEIYVANAYQLLLGRAPDPSAQTWVDMLNAGIGPSTVILGIEGSIEYLNIVVDDLYQQYLGRPADAGAKTWVMQLADGMTIEWVTAQICGSAEYSSLYPTDQDFINALYLDVFNRSPDPTGEATWLAALANGESRTNVAYEFVISQEYRNNLVAEYYTTFLGATDPAGQAGWVNELNNGATQQFVLAGIFGSPQGYSKWSM